MRDCDLAFGLDELDSAWCSFSYLGTRKSASRLKAKSAEIANLRSNKRHHQPQTQSPRSIIDRSQPVPAYYCRKRAELVKMLDTVTGGRTGYKKLERRTERTETRGEARPFMTGRYALLSASELCTDNQLLVTAKAKKEALTSLTILYAVEATSRKTASTATKMRMMSMSDCEVQVCQRCLSPCRAFKRGPTYALLRLAARKALGRIIPLQYRSCEDALHTLPDQLRVLRAPDRELLHTFVNAQTSTTLVLALA